MRIRMLVVAAVLGLTACRGHEAITGGYGSTGVSGVVSMAAGMTNSSPQGVRVAVGGTGMSAVLGTDGRFSFFGVPENPTLTFTRDDLSASIKVESSTASLQIELNSNSANVGRRRVVPSGPLMQIEGLITDIGTTDITVHDSHNQDVKVTITDGTAIYRGNQKLQLSDLKVGDQVHVQAKVNGDEKDAVVILLQNPADNSGDGGNNTSQTMTANGTVKDVGSGQLTVTTVPKGDVVVKVDDHTIIKKQSARITLADIHVGDQVNTMGTRIDDHTLQAKQIEVRGVSGHH